ncbi:FadR family transcriptional regulator [Cryobacterium algoritolerans]|uniref:FadR family transcriptional regulator n=1 Tax=Cryobacterium algoritolerans TaxID=1259184 RepID=A0A4R8WK27_9MICO|nr:GntR family transcriptional regulator [Cryobacterium algoritolerans]TFC09678.1 FadR family transcriptional regulator [Cryobacterium algoritolerans]
MPGTDRRAWEVVLESIEADLLSGRLAPGDHLPAERALAADLGVGRSSVREALRVLEVLGLIRTAAGSGPSAGAIVVALPGGGMSALMRLQVAAQGFPVADVVKTRLILEAAVVAELARASEPAGDTGPAGASAHPDLTGSAQLLDAMEAPDLTEAEFLALDTQFHLSLATASGNQVITATMAGLRSAIEGYAQAGALGLASWAETSARLRGEHRGILAAIDSADPELARALVVSHIEGYYAETHDRPLHARPPAPEPT